MQVGKVLLSLSYCLFDLFDLDVLCGRQPDHPRTWLVECRFDSASQMALYDRYCSHVISVFSCLLFILFFRFSTALG